MRLLLCAGALFAFAAAATAQTPEQAAPPPAQCADIPADPPMPDGASASTAQMRAANEAYSAWLEDIRALHECRRLQFNASSPA